MNAIIDRSKLLNIVSGLNLSELRELNAMICSEIKMHNDMRQRKVAATLTRGATVKFTGKYGEVLQGKITKINMKTVQVETARGMWRVSPSLLSVVA